MEEIDSWMCPNCMSIYKDEEMAKNCCIRRAERISAFRCECGKLYFTENEVEECCG